MNALDLLLVGGCVGILVVVIAAAVWTKLYSSSELPEEGDGDE